MERNPFGLTWSVVRFRPQVLRSRMNQKRAKFLGMLLGLSMLVGCGSSGGGHGSTPAPTATLTASPATIIAEQESSTLTFTSTNADTGTIDNAVGPVGMNSHINVTPLTTTTYTYTATGPGGSATAQATVTVTPPGPAPTVTFGASSTLIFAGQSISLTWTSTNATLLVIDNNLGSLQPISGGSVSVSPTTTTTYTITATGNGQQAVATATISVTPVNSFDGIAEDPLVTPRDVDPNGAVGTLQFMEYVNTVYQAYDKITFQPVWPSPRPIGTPWSAIPQCAGTGIKLDAVINFDRLASRWVIAGRSTVPSSFHYYLCIAVSSTDDLSSPTLTWHAYFSDLNPYFANPAGGLYLPDWLRLGTWPDAYYATFDMFDNTNGWVVGVVVCALDRTNMLSNGTQNPMQCVPVTGPLDNAKYLGHSLIPADVDGITPPPPGRDEFMVSIQNPSITANATTSGTINLWDFHVNWTSPASLIYTLTTLPVTTYTPGCYFYLGASTTTNCVAEPQAAGAGQHIDSVGDRLMPRFAYRNFGSYESFLVSQTVQTGLSGSLNPWQTGIRWYELRPDLTGTPSVFQSATINPDTQFFRFLPSIAQDKDGNAAVGYSVSSVFSNPAIDFSYWSLTTPTAPTGEVTIIDGPAEEVSPTTGIGEWGSYSSMTVDPTDDCTFWYVNEYWTLLAGQTNSSWATRIANFKMPTCQ